MQPWGRNTWSLIPPQILYITISFISFAGTKALKQVKDDNFKMSTGFLEHHWDITLCYLTTNQKKATHPATPTLNLAHEIFFPKNH